MIALYVLGYLIAGVIVSFIFALVFSETDLDKFMLGFVAVIWPVILIILVFMLALTILGSLVNGLADVLIRLFER